MTLTTSLPPNAPAAPSGSAPSLQGRYDLAEMIGRGGMATVYRALDTALDRAVAVKLLHPSISNEPEFVDQFLAMERRIARLFHPNLVTIFDAGRSGVPDHSIVSDAIKPLLVGHQIFVAAAPAATPILIHGFPQGGFIRS